MVDPKDIDADQAIDQLPHDQEVDANAGDEEDEIFSNHPGAPVEVEEEDFTRRGSHDDDDEQDDDGGNEVDSVDPDTQESPQTVRRPEVKLRPKTVEELLLDAVPQRARAAGDKLKLHLTGKILISIRNSTQRYLLDWSGADMVTSRTDSSDADCTITLSESDLMKISTGDLNPQISMLSHKVNVTGKADHAMYVFNLIAPHSSL